MRFSEISVFFFHSVFTANRTEERHDEKKMRKKERKKKRSAQSDTQSHTFFREKVQAVVPCLQHTVVSHKRYIPHFSETDARISVAMYWLAFHCVWGLTFFHLSFALFLPFVSCLCRLFGVYTSLYMRLYIHLDMVCCMCITVLCSAV